MILNLSYPVHHSVNDFINSELCSFKYASIDDAVKMVRSEKYKPFKRDIHLILMKIV